MVLSGTPANALLAWIESVPAGARIEVQYKVIRDVRSVKQNARYWSLVVPIAAEVLSVGRDIPLSKDQAHYVLKSAFIGVEETPLGTFPKSSKDLDVEQFLAFTRKAEEWLVTQYGLVIPERGEDLE